MRLFSKRHKTSSNDEIRRNYRYFSLINNELRNRIAAEVFFLTSRDDFLEFFILFENQREDKIFLDSNKIDGFSLAELGYKMSDFFEFEDFAIKEQVSDEPGIGIEGRKILRENKKITYIDDYKLFDLLELLIVFSQKDKREDLIDRFNLVLREEESVYEIVNGTITRKTGENLNTISNLLKDQNLKKKIIDFEYFKQRDDYINMSKTSAEILNIIFSEANEDKKKTHIEELLSNLSKKIALTKSNDLYGQLLETLRILKGLCNSIYNVRHTEKSTIQVNYGDNNIIYKMLAEQNISFVELVLVTLKSEFVFSENWEEIKENYIEKYQIDKDVRYVIKRPIDDEEISVEDLPF